MSFLELRWSLYRFLQPLSPNLYHPRGYEKYADILDGVWRNRYWWEFYFQSNVPQVSAYYTTSE